MFTNRVFATSSLTLVLVAISVFGSFLLLPLYFHTVRGESALQSGLLLAPQGFGSMLAMPLAGQLSHRTGTGRIVPFGLVATGLAVLGLTQVGADTSYWLIGIELFVFGIGMGFTMMPVFTGAMQTMREAAVARASTALIGAAAAVPPSVRAKVAPPMAAAFGQTFWWALALIAVAFVGSLALPRQKPRLAPVQASPAPIPLG